jgi:hypothetical protein
MAAADHAASHCGSTVRPLSAGDGDRDQAVLAREQARASAL